jgi:hypothetical protein
MTGPEIQGEKVLTRYRVAIMGSTYLSPVGRIVVRTTVYVRAPNPHQARFEAGKLAAAILSERVEVTSVIVAVADDQDESSDSDRPIAVESIH